MLLPRSIPDRLFLAHNPPVKYRFKATYLYNFDNLNYLYKTH